MWIAYKKSGGNLDEKIKTYSNLSEFFRVNEVVYGGKVISYKSAKNRMGSLRACKSFHFDNFYIKYVEIVGSVKP